MVSLLKQALGDMQRVSARDGKYAEGDKDAHRVQLCPSAWSLLLPARVPLQVKIKKSFLSFALSSPHHCVKSS